MIYRPVQISEDLELRPVAERPLGGGLVELVQNGNDVGVELDGDEVDRLIEVLQEVRDR